MVDLLAYAYLRFAENFDVYDGDSIKADLDEGDHRWEKQRALRLYGVDTPELAPPWEHYGGDAGKKDPSQVDCRDAEKRAAREARDRVKTLIDAATGTVLVQTIKLPGRDVRDKYGRTLARIYVPLGEVWVDVAKLLLSEKHARPYMGGRKVKWTMLRDPGVSDPAPQLVAKSLAD